MTNFSEKVDKCSGDLTVAVLILKGNVFDPKARSTSLRSQVFSLKPAFLI